MIRKIMKRRKRMSRFFISAIRLRKFHRELDDFFNQFLRINHQIDK